MEAADRLAFLVEAADRLSQRYNVDRRTLKFRAFVVEREISVCAGGLHEVTSDLPLGDDLEQGITEVSAKQLLAKTLRATRTGSVLWSS